MGLLIKSQNETAAASDLSVRDLIRGHMNTCAAHRMKRQHVAKVHGCAIDICLLLLFHPVTPEYLCCHGISNE